MAPIAPARGPGPATIGTPQASRCAITSASGTGGDEAQISRTRSRPVGYQAWDVVGGMQVHFLMAKAQCGATSAKANDFHAQHPGVKFAGALDVRDRQNQVIEAFD